MNNSKIFIAVILALFLLSFKSENTIPLKFTIKMRTNYNTNYDDFIIQLCFANVNKNNQVFVTKHPVLGFDYAVLKVKNADIIFEIEKIEDNIYKKQQCQDLNNFFLPFFPPEDMYDTVKYNKSVCYEFNIYSYYTFLKGSYRVRAKFRIPKINRINSVFTYSNWIKFDVDSKIIFPPSH